MKQHHALAGAIALLALGLFANALAILFSPKGEPAPAAAPFVTNVQAQPGGSGTPPMYFLARNTYFLSQNMEGDTVYLWHYDHHPIKRNNSIEFLLKAQAR